MILYTHTTFMATLAQAETFTKGGPRPPAESLPNCASLRPVSTAAHALQQVASLSANSLQSRGPVVDQDLVPRSSEESPKLWYCLVGKEFTKREPREFEATFCLLARNCRKVLPPSADRAGQVGLAQEGTFQTLAPAFHLLYKCHL